MPPQAPHNCRMKGFTGQSAAPCPDFLQRVQNKQDEAMVAIVERSQSDRLPRNGSEDLKRRQLEPAPTSCSA